MKKILDWSEFATLDCYILCFRLAILKKTRFSAWQIRKKSVFSVGKFEINAEL